MQGHVHTYPDIFGNVLAFRPRENSAFGHQKRRCLENVSRCRFFFKRRFIVIVWTDKNRFSSYRVSIVLAFSFGWAKTIPVQYVGRIFFEKRVKQMFVFRFAVTCGSAPRTTYPEISTHVKFWNKDDKPLRHVAMIAKFLDLDKPWSCNMAEKK